MFNSLRKRRSRYHKNRSRSVRQDFCIEPLEPRRLLATFQILGAGFTNQETISLQIQGETVQTWDRLGGDARTGEYVSLEFYNRESVAPEDVRIQLVGQNDPGQSHGVNANLSGGSVPAANETPPQPAVRIDALILDGTRYETEAPDVYSSGAWESGRWCALRFSTQRSATCRWLL